MNKVLITGGTGFIGHHVLSLLAARGIETHAVYHASEPTFHNSCLHWHRADLLDKQQARDLVRLTLPDQLIHLAWYTTPPKYWEASENASWVEASNGLFREFADAGGKRILAVGTCAEYVWSGDYCTEDSTPLAPASQYGKSKKVLQTALAELAAARGISAAWARIFFPYGPGEHPSKLVTYIATALLNGEEAHCATPEQKRDFIYVADVASALVAVLCSGYSGSVNIGTGQSVAVREVAEKVANKIGRHDLLRFRAPDTSPNAAPPVVANIEKLRKLIQWSPAYSIDEGIASTIAWCTSQSRTAN